MNISGTSAAGNAILGNAIYANSQMGINLVASSDTGTGVTVNDGIKSSGQPNLLMDSAIITSANLTNTQLTVAGYVGSAPNQSVFASARIEIFVNEVGTTKSSGRKYLGFLASNANGSFSGTLDVTGKGVIAVDKLTASATDTSNNTSEFGNVWDVNVAPIGLNDNATAIEAGGFNNATAGTNPTGNVLTNDTDPDGDALTVSAVAAGTTTNPTGAIGSPIVGSYGSITIQANGVFTYTLNNSLAIVEALRTTADTLTEVFSYSVRDSSNITSVSQITITIVGANDAPTITAIPNQSTNEDVPTNPIAFTITDVDSPLNGLVMSGTSATTSVVSSNGFSFAGTTGSRTVTVAPASNASGSSVLTLRVTDSTLFAESTFTLTVTGTNDAPTLSSAVELQLSPIYQLDPMDLGNSVSSILASQGTTPITDPDLNPSQGIAIWDAFSPDGQWQYSTDQALTWITASAVSQSSALLLRSIDRIRYVPLTENTGIYPFSFYAWDQTEFSYGTKVNVSTRGGTKSLSTNSAIGKANVSNVAVSFVDDGEANFTTSGSWTSDPSGRLADTKLAPSNSNATATWTFNVPAGTYNIAATWLVHVDPATQQVDSTFNAQFNVAGTIVSVDQSIAPNDFWSAGVNWKRLATITSTGNPIAITLSGMPDSIGKLIADSIRLESASSSRGRETNDTIANASEISLFPGIPVTVGGYVGDGAYLGSDVDLYKVNLTAGQVLNIQVDSQTPEYSTDNSNAQTRIRMFNSAGTEVASMGSTPGSDPKLDFTAATAGNYFIGIASSENAVYSASVAAGRPINVYKGSYQLRMLTPIIPPSTEYANTYTVTTLEDSASTNQMTLRRAIELANTAGGNNLIELGSLISGDIQLSQGILNITSSITIRESNVANTITIKPAVSGALFTVATNAKLRLEGVILRGASSTGNGASVKVDGNLVLDRTEIRNSSSAIRRCSICEQQWVRTDDPFDHFR